MHLMSGLPASFNPDDYDMIVVGAGYAGSVCARRVAEGAGFRVAVLERRDHIAGNAYDFENEDGILFTSTAPYLPHVQRARERVPLALHQVDGLPAQGARQHPRHAHAGALQPHEPEARVSARNAARSSTRSSSTPSVPTRRCRSWSFARRTIPTCKRSRTTYTRTCFCTTR